jgi:hypothetical protein
MIDDIIEANDQRKSLIASLLNEVTSPFPVFYEKLQQGSSKKIISFCLYGSKPLYYLGAEKNIEEAKKIYPDYMCRFYCTKDVPNLNKLKILAENGECELIVPNLTSPPVFWRILACDDPNVEICLQRDCDSIVNDRERVAVEEWLKSGKTLHFMHDCQRGHFHKIMAGMWGIKKTDKFNFTEELKNFYTHKQYGEIDPNNITEGWGSGKATYFDDQYFLKDILYERFKDDYIEHGEENPFPNHEPLKYGSFVGDRVFASDLLKQKNSTDKNKIFIQSHLAIDDQMPLNGMIRHFCETKEKVIFAVRQDNYNLINYCLSDLDNLDYQILKGNEDGVDFYANSYDSNEIGLVALGNYGDNVGGSYSFIDKCYVQAGLDPNIKKDKFHIPNTPTNILSEQETDKLNHYKNQLQIESSQLDPFNINKNKVRIAFHTNEIGVRGSEWATYKYAHHNEKILGNESIYIAGPTTSQFERPESHKAFSERFKVYRYDNWTEVDDILKAENIDIMYMHKGGNNDGKYSKIVKTCIHSVFQMCDPHGDKYAYISEWLSQVMGEGKYPFVPYMIDSPNEQSNLRQELNIPNEAIVFGRLGGPDQFDIPFVHEAIKQVLSEREDVYFLFGFTNEFVSHPRVIHYPPFCDESFKAKFINSCDAMIHARNMGESFGLAIAEFSSKNKPIITLNGGNDKAHLQMLGNKALYYNDYEEVYSILRNFTKDICSFRNWDAYSEKYNPNSVMQKFKEVFID